MDTTNTTEPTWWLFTSPNDDLVPTYQVAYTGTLKEIQGLLGYQATQEYLTLTPTHLLKNNTSPWTRWTLTLGVDVLPLFAFDNQQHQTLDELAGESARIGEHLPYYVAEEYDLLDTQKIRILTKPTRETDHCPITFFEGSLDPDTRHTPETVFNAYLSNYQRRNRTILEVASGENPETLTLRHGSYDKNTTQVIPAAHAQPLPGATDVNRYRCAHLKP